jgi:PAS domain S-box-containing protein
LHFNRQYLTKQTLSTEKNMTKQSIVNRIAVGSTALIICVFIVALTANYWRAAKQADTDIENQLTRQLNLLSQSLEGPLWSLDDATIKLIGDAFMSGKDIVSLEIFSQDNPEAIFIAQQADTTEALYGGEDILHNSQTIGHIRIGLSGASYKTALTHLLFNTLVLAAISFLSIILLLRFLLKKTLGEPLNQLGTWAENIASGRYNDSPPQTTLEELNSLARKFADMSAKIQAREHSLQSSENLFREFFQANPMGTIITSPDGNIHLVNPAFTSTTGFEASDVIDRTVEEMRFWRNPEDRQRMVSTIKEKGFISNFESAFFGEGGKLMTCLISSTLVMHEGESRIISVVHDISEQKQAQEELNKYQNHLEELVEEKTTELQEAQSALLQRERLATLGKLTATVSHEILNPLGSVRNALFSINAYQERNEPERTAQAIEIAERNISRCVKIIEEMNGFARVKNLEISEIPLDGWLESVLDEMTLPDEIDCSLELISNFSVHIDQEKLRQVAVNLINNAVHALQDKDSKDKQLRIITRQLDNHFEVHFIDNGIGMSDDTLENIFEPLYSTKGFGVGLGMVIVKNIVQQHHGEISIESKPGQGTTIIIRLPKTIAEG